MKAIYNQIYNETKNKPYDNISKYIEKHYANKLSEYELDSIEIYCRWNAGDPRLSENDCDYAKEILYIK